MLSSCFGRRRKTPRRDPEREPLLPQYAQDTRLQRELYGKLHSYQMVRAMTQGYMPSTEQAISQLRTLLACEILNPDNPDLSDSGHKTIHLVKMWIQQLITLLQKKNGADQFQDFVWFLTKSRISLDTDDLQARAKKAKVDADTAAAYDSLRTIGSLLLTNSEFRVFLDDLGILGREIFKDSADALSEAAHKAGEQLEPTTEEQQRISAEPAESSGSQAPPASETLKGELKDIEQVVTDRAADVATATAESTEKKIKGDEGRTLRKRLQKVVMNLHKRDDYTESVSLLSQLIKRYATAYSQAAEKVVEAVDNDVQENEETDKALKNIWEFVKSFGNREQWEKCQECLNTIMDHKQHDPEFEDLMRQVGNSLQELLTDPSFFNESDTRLKELRDRSKSVGAESELRRDVDQLLHQVSLTLQSVAHDTDIHEISATTQRIFNVLSPKRGSVAINPELWNDAINVFLPLFISAVQHIPIPRLELSNPAMDLLIENLVIEPGRGRGQTINNPNSFLPHRLRVEAHNDVDIRKARLGLFRTKASTTHIVRVRLDGLCARADDVGYWLRLHGGWNSPLLFGLADQGLASIALDERGVDVQLEIEISPNSGSPSAAELDQILALRAVRVRIHGFDYRLRGAGSSGTNTTSTIGDDTQNAATTNIGGRFSRFMLDTLAKPLLRRILRSALERRLAAQIAETLRAANRELVYGRERLRAARIMAARPDTRFDLWTFVRAVAARQSSSSSTSTTNGSTTTNGHHHGGRGKGRRGGGGGGGGDSDGDTYFRIGWMDEPGATGRGGAVTGADGGHVFRGVYTPGSIARVWREEARGAQHRVDEYVVGGWRNGVFDVPPSHGGGMEAGEAGVSGSEEQRQGGQEEEEEGEESVLPGPS